MSLIDARWPPGHLEAVSQALLEEFSPDIGRLVIVFGALEAKIDWGLMYALNVHPDKLDPVLAQFNSLHAKAGLLETLICRADERRARIAKQLYNEIVGVNKFRNRIIHGEWGGFGHRKDGIPVLYKRYMGRNKHTRENFEFTLDDVSKNVIR